MEKKILILPGDGIGQEVTSSMNEVLNYLIDEQGLDFHISDRKVGGHQLFYQIYENLDLAHQLDSLKLHSLKR